MKVRPRNQMDRARDRFLAEGQVRYKATSGLLVLLPLTCWAWVSRYEVIPKGLDSLA